MSSSIIEGNINAGVNYLDIPDKSENDKKHYKTLKLPNGLLVLLISDPTPVPHDGFTTSSVETTDDSSSEESDQDEEELDGIDPDDDDDSEEGDEKLAACALMIDVGSFSDPKEYQGLSHFLEHMIFMGSKQFPAENAFDAHVKKCGGFDNAHTECEETMFYFECSEEHLNSTIEIFSALFKEPLMKKEAMTRERDAVESEFQNTILDDEARRDQLLASLANPNYPNSIFAWGNLQSLKENIDDEVLYQRTHEFRIKHYSSHRMYLCIQARLPIEELEEMAVKHFKDIPNNNQDGDDFSAFNYRDAFRPEFYQRVYFVKPVENVNKVELTWCLPALKKAYRCKPDHFLSYMIGYEGKGSLCAYLRNKLWAMELISGVDDSGFDANSIYSLFNLCIYLTDEGFVHLKEVLEATFAYIKQLSTCETLEASYKELQYIEDTGFRYQSQKTAFDNVQNVTVNMKHYPPKDIITGPELYFEYNSEEVLSVIRQLNEFNFNIMITSEKKYNGVTYDQKEKWFGTEYTSIEMPIEWIDAWNNCPYYQELFVPEPNIYIAHDFRILWKENGEPETPAYPKKILQTDVCELWFRQDDKFNLPDAMMYFYFISPLPRINAKNDVLTALYVQYIKYDLAEALYPATCAGMEYNFYSAEKGVVLKVNGYNEKLHLLVDAITKTMTSLGNSFEGTLRELQLTCFKAHQKKAYFNAVIKPKLLNKDIRLTVLENIRWPLVEKFTILQEISLQEIQEFSKNYTKELYIQALMQGNLIEETAHNVMNSVLTTLNCQKVNDSSLIESRTCQIPQGSNYVQCNAINIADQNSVVCNFYQIGPCSLRIEGILDLLMMFVDEPLFDTLRTKEQLGYDVSASVRINSGIAGYSITVQCQESKFTAQYVEERIEAFRMQMMTILNDLHQEEYEHVRESLIKIKQVIDASLAEEVNRNWGEISCEEYLFDRRKREVEILKRITKQDLIEFLLENERNNLRKLSVQVIGHKKESDAINSNNEESTLPSEDVIEGYIPKFVEKTLPNVLNFKKRMLVYPVTKTSTEANSSSPMNIIENC
ncbi:nardilysin isoform X2 [Episyrphus balteatus]|nr:nardilysin isoform X2 [Episyrphus balteatus]XP_055843467.1 nardilysin isoform X2 [Episyrphus balteatus]